MKRFRIVGVAAFTCVSLIASDEDKMSRLLAEAERGSTEAMIELAAAYHGGMGTPMDLEAAADWLRKAAAAGIPEAYVWLGEMHETGAGVPRDLQVARELYEIAAAAGVPSANFRLGLVYFEGWGLPADPNAGIAFLRRAAEAGYVPAERLLAAVLMFGLKVPKDPGAALHWAETAAATEDTKAVTLVGTAYFEGLGVAKNVGEAREWYNEAAHRMDSNAMVEIAYTYFEGEPTPANFVEMIRWLDLASRLGNERASLIFASFLAGRTPQSPVEPAGVLKARELIERSANNGSSLAASIFKYEKEGMTFPEAVRYVTQVPLEDQYADSWNLKDDNPGDRQPRILKAVQPVYPTGMVLEGVNGEVMLRFVVTGTGNVEDVTVDSSTHPGFEENAILAVKQWRFSPGMVGGKPVDMKSVLTVRFVMLKESWKDSGESGKKSQPD